MRLFDTPLQPVYFQHLPIEDRKRILIAGAVAAELHDGASNLYRYMLPNCKIFACEEIRDGKVVLGETKNILIESTCCLT